MPPADPTVPPEKNGPEGRDEAVVSSEAGRDPEAAAEAPHLYPDSYTDAYGTSGSWSSAPAAVESPPQTATGGGGGLPPSSGGGGDDGDSDEDEQQMAKMSFLEHLEELRTRIIYTLIAVAGGFFICFGFSRTIFEHMSEPVRSVLREMGLADKLYYPKPTDAFTMYLNLALVAGLFLASPVVIYQIWAFIAPGLYKRERKYAVPFIFFCSTLFISGGAFGYFIAFPMALKFLLTFGGDKVVPWITITDYVDTFWTVILGLGIVFELPVLMLFLGLLGILTPSFLIRNFRYAVLLIFVVAAVITPTADITNLMIFAIPMMALYFVGVGLVWIAYKRRQRRDLMES
ncbi:MAG: twin-arginine translocase subunit TatC [Gammaproteobacteria bacterium]